MKAELWSWVKKEDHEMECNAAGHDQCFASKVDDTWERLWPWKSHWEANLELSAHRTTGPRTLYSQYARKPVKGFKQEMRWSYVSQFTLTTDKHELEGRKEQNQWYLFAMVHKSDENESDLGGDWIWREVDRFRRYLASKYPRLSRFRRTEWWGSGSCEKWLSCFWFEQLSLRGYPL